MAKPPAKKKNIWQHASQGLPKLHRCDRYRSRHNCTDVAKKKKKKNCPNRAKAIIVSDTQKIKTNTIFFLMVTGETPPVYIDLMMPQKTSAVSYATGQPHLYNWRRIERSHCSFSSIAASSTSARWPSEAEEEDVRTKLQQRRTWRLRTKRATRCVLRWRLFLVWRRP